ncbi:NAD(P)-dependent dehydrogenase (short-subunit alcohol dehydrogenase family) [Lipingzhangella halophila]|uniref:NAD(P)-dependent dehydrogenase (Short-subunit alcohol dehydrogenase family) n=1 Tax=Lipingzhangella halophila TaxID=1783352 RepID=A0A7W7RKS1_9ACTN|nr:SDR family oxidoreductase [Lipingzhangella halophila]MBB4933770.1 NAD(P)-dependent dehydrogenase (short-subunit alcohol dehydrogenase family) [Lipingzhangella halophila]
MLRHASADPADPRWAEVREAAGRVHRAEKKHRKAERRDQGRAEERALFAATERYRDQAPAPTAATGGDPPPPSVGVLAAARPCYVCQTSYRLVSGDYHLLCPDCAEYNRQRRHARCSLRGRRAVVTGGRIKIGFHTALKMLRDGAEVVVTTRFPRDAARRFTAVPDSGEWLSRLRVYGVDFLDPAAVDGFLADLHQWFDHLDILVNNAAQTIRRPAAYHREVRAGEREPLTGRAAQVAIAAADRAAGPLTGAAGAATALTPRAEETAAPALFPAGRVDESGEPLDLRPRNSWSLRLHEVDPAEWLECHVVNAFVPFVLTARLRGLLESSPRPDRYVVQVSAMEGSFSRPYKSSRHPHTNMAKASLNMLSRTSAADYAAAGIHMNSVDTGWVTDENPHPTKTALREAGFRPPLDVIDGAARVYDPIVRGVNGEPVSGRFLKDFRAVEW